MSVSTLLNSRLMILAYTGFYGFLCACLMLQKFDYKIVNYFEKGFTIAQAGLEHGVYPRLTSASRVLGVVGVDYLIPQSVWKFCSFYDSKNSTQGFMHAIQMLRQPCPILVSYSISVV